MTDHDSVKRFPLEWPLGWKRTPARQRQKATFQTTKTEIVARSDGSRHVVKRAVNVSIFVATQRLEKQVELLGGVNPTLSTNVSLRLDGRPRSEGEPTDPGVALYFSFRGKATVLACDRYLTVGGNIAALAAHIEALRRIERYGVGTIEQALAGYKALPADTAANWRAVFGFSEDSTPTLDQLDTAYKTAAKQRHPDVGGTDIEMAHVNRARDYALMELDA